jgi:hypothetical protein
MIQLSLTRKLFDLNKMEREARRRHLERALKSDPPTVQRCLGAPKFIPYTLCPPPAQLYSEPLR